MGKTVTYLGKEYVFEDYYSREIKDHLGKKWVVTNYFPYDFIMENTDHFKTTLKLVNWISKNRDKFLDHENQLHHYFGPMSDEWHSWFTEVECLSEFFAGQLREEPLRSSKIANEGIRTLLIDDLLPNATQVIENIFGCRSFTQVINAGVRMPSTKWTDKKTYSTRMNPEDYNFFRGEENHLYFGMELEVSTRLSCGELQAIVTEVEPKQEPFFIMKSDSSITGRFDNKVELVTVPCTPRYLRKNWKIFFHKLEKLTRSKGETIHDYFDTSYSLNNGIHIHVNKESFSDYIHLNKFIQVWHQTDMLTRTFMHRISKRPGKHFTENRYCVYNKNFRGLSFAAKMKAANRTRKAADTHFFVCQDGNDKTVEVRLFQGIFDLHHIFQCIGYVESIFEFCWEKGFTSFGANFTREYESFLSGKTKYRAINGEKKCA